MSLILDALRKSEAERRRGQAPDLFATVTLSPTRRSRSRLRFWPVVVFGVLVLAAGWVLWRGQQASTSTPEESSFDGAPVADAGTDTSVATEPVRSSPTTVGPAPVPPPARVDAERPPSPPAPTASVASTASPARIEARPTPETLPLATPPLPSPSTTAAVLPPAPPEEDALESLPPIAVLSASERAALPPLKLSMHVFGAEPGKRFAIIDGQRVTEGSILGGGIIEQIRRDGVVININGRRVLLPRP